MFFKKEKINEEMLKQAFLKVKQENEELKKRLEIVEKKLIEFEQNKAVENQKIEPVKQSETLKSSPIQDKQEATNTNKEVELIKSNLTQSEKEILYLFTMSKDKSYSYEDLSGIMKKSSHTVKAQIQSMIKKGIKLSFNQNDKGQRSFYLDSEMFERIIMTKNK